MKELTVGYGSEIVLENYSFVFEGPGLLQVMGPNGAGKTTLLRTLVGILKPIRGHVLVDGMDVHRDEEARKLIGYVPQLLPKHGLHPVSVWEFVELCTRCRLGKSCRDRVEEVLKLVGLDREVWKKNFWNLSGGQRQRVLIACALVNDPPLLVLDEPLSNVDPAAKASLITFIVELSRSRTIVMTCHDPTPLLPYTKAVLLMNRKFYRYGKPDEVLTLENLRKVYGGVAMYVESHVHVHDYHIASPR